jgi:nucleoside-diphosphate-sugar epimerase
VPAGLAFAAAQAGERLGSLLPTNPARYLTTGVEQVRHGQFLNCSKAERDLGMRRRPLEETFRDSLAWFRTNRYL